MRKSALFGLTVAASMSLGACATNDRYGDGYGHQNQGVQRAATGAAIGGAAGAALGAVVGGISPVEGAIAGAVAGGVIGAVTDNNGRKWYRDTRGYCFYVNDRGERIYNYDARC